jgi:hypothetical protein
VKKNKKKVNRKEDKQPKMLQSIEVSVKEDNKKDKDNANTSDSLLELRKMQI